MKERLFYSELLNEIRLYRFNRFHWMIVKDCGSVCDRGVSFDYVGDL